MIYGRILAVGPDGVVVEGATTRAKPMKVPKGLDPKVGDYAVAEKIGAAYIVLSIYGGEANGQQP